MSKKRSHYKATTKRGFEAGELAALLARHSPDADYRVVISFRGKVRELIVDEDGDVSPFVLKEVPREECDAGACLPPDTERIQGKTKILPVDDQRHGGKLEAALHDPRAQYPRAQDFRPVDEHGRPVPRSFLDRIDIRDRW